MISELRGGVRTKMGMGEAIVVRHFGGDTVDQSHTILALIKLCVKYIYSSIVRKLRYLFEEFCKEKKTKG